MPEIQVQNVSIRFPGVKALNDVSFKIESGKVTALCGENGAGKSTLGKILAGVYSYKDYEGSIFIDGEKFRGGSILDAEKKGITIIHQELNLLQKTSVAENIFLNNYPNKLNIVQYDKLYAEAKALLQDMGVDLDPRKKVSDLTVSFRQIVEIAKALAKNPSVLIFDEATSSLGENQVKLLFRIIERLREKHVTMIYVTHKLDEIFHVCDDIIVLKDGAFVWKKPIAEISKHDVVTAMVGRELSQMYPPRRAYKGEEEVLRVENWNIYGSRTEDDRIEKDVSFCLHKGEILGFYGLVGAGRSELMNSIFEGKKRIKSSGDLYIHGEKCTISHTQGAIRKKLSMVPEDRKHYGLNIGLSCRENIALASLKWRSVAMGIIQGTQEVLAVEEMIERLNVKVSHMNRLVNTLSGGNQQKVVLGKWLLTDPEILIMDEPTRGIDVGAKAEIYKILHDLADRGVSVIVVSGELPEILGVCNRVLVMREGIICAEFEAEKAAEAEVLRYAVGRT